MFQYFKTDSPCVGVDEHTIIDVLVKKSNAQRQEIKEAYLKASGKVRQTHHALANPCATSILVSHTHSDCPDRAVGFPPSRWRAL